MISGSQIEPFQKDLPYSFAVKLALISGLSRATFPGQVLTHYASIILGIIGIENSIRDGILGKNLVKTCVIEYSSHVICVFHSNQLQGPKHFSYRANQAKLQTSENNRLTSNQIPTQAKAFTLILLVHSSSAAAEREFLLLQNSFSHVQ